MKTLYLLPLLFFAVIWLIRASFAGQQKQVYIAKPLATLLVIAAAGMAFLAPNQHPVYTFGILIGLILSLGGDIALMFSDRPKAFLIGLVFFLLAHIAYTAVFSLLGRFSIGDILSAAILILIGVAFYRLIRPGLGAMKAPVIGYMLVISLMVNRAFSTFASPIFSSGQAWMISMGAVLFYLSDMILAANRFWKPWRFHHWSLALYYAGQFLLAVAASYFA